MSKIQRKLNNGKSNDSESPKFTTFTPSVVFPDSWRKFLPTDLTSPWWYSEDDLEKLIFSHIADTRKGGRDLPLRDFIRQFRGLSATGKAKTICSMFSGVRHLTDFETQRHLITQLLMAMKGYTSPPTPNILGLVGEDHYRKCFDEWFGIKCEETEEAAQRFWYEKAIGPSAKERQKGEPIYAFEIAIAETEEIGDFFPGLNFTLTYNDFFEGELLATSKIDGQGILGFLRSAHVDLNDAFHTANTAVAVHLICPRMQFLDRGKTRLSLTEKSESEDS